MIGDKSWRPFEPCAENQFLALFHRYPWMRYVIGLLVPTPAIKHQVTPRAKP